MALALAACAPVGAGAPRGELGALDGEWAPTFPDFGAAAPALTIAGARVEGGGGCNGFSGQLQRGGAALRFVDLSATEMACAPEVMEKEAIFFEALAQTRSAARTGDTLSLFDAGGATVLQLAPRRAPEAIAGVDWVLAAGAWNAEPPSLRIGEAGVEAGVEAGGFTGCNSWFATVAQDGAQLRFSDIGMTKKACIGPSGAAEMAFIANLRRVARYRLEGRFLRLLDEAGVEVMRLTPAGGGR